MSFPILSSATSRLWISNVNPTTDEENIEIGNFWLNMNTLGFFICIDETPSALVWQEFQFVSSLS